MEWEIVVPYKISWNKSQAGGSGGGGGGYIKKHTENYLSNTLVM